MGWKRLNFMNDEDKFHSPSLKGIDSNSPLKFDEATNFQILEMWRKEADKSHNSLFEQFKSLQNKLNTLLPTLATEGELQSLANEVNEALKLKADKKELPKSQLEVKPLEVKKEQKPKESPSWSKALKSLLP